MIDTIIRYNTEQTPMKLRKVTVFKREVYDDLELYTYKHVEASDIQDPKKANAVSADTSESLDGRILTRHVKFREAKLRKLVPFAMAKKTDLHADDVPELDDDKLVFWLKLPEDWDDNLLDPLAQYFHRFIVWGALYDWYGEIGSPQAAFYARDLEELEAEIINSLRTPSIAKKPLQPFGPAKRRPY